MKTLIARRLAPLASYYAQQRLIQNATKDEYMLAEEVLEDAHEAVRLAGLSISLTVAQRSAIGDLESVLNCSMPNFSDPKLIDGDPAWIRLRESAIECLRALEFDLGRWEALEVSTAESSNEH